MNNPGPLLNGHAVLQGTLKPQNQLPATLFPIFMTITISHIQIKLTSQFGVHN